jgi:hypothetical protein
MHHSPETTGEDTIWAYTLRKNTFVCNLLTGLKSTTVTNRPIAALVYMVCHAFVCAILTLFSYLCVYSYTIHSLFCAGLFIYAVYAGSARYFKMITWWYQQSIQNLLIVE